MKIRFKRRAQDEVRKAAAWWAEHRRDAQLIERELTQAFVRLLEHPYLGEPVPNASVPMLRRLYLRRVRYHLYYVIDGTAIVVMAFWHSSRNSPNL